VLRVHQALEQLERSDVRAAQMVEMRYFGGYSDREIAATLDITERTVQRDWEKAKMLLRLLLDSE
jgi:RNA polymerase sigma factor (sigma-70 family)